MFADTPWIISPPTWIAGYPSLYSEFWPAERRMGRLHAMGYDAYNLVSRLYSSGESLQPEYIGATGRLYLGDDGRIHRRLAWAQFVRGEIMPLPEIDLPAEILEDDTLNNIDNPGQPTEWPSHELRQ